MQEQRCDRAWTVLTAAFILLQLMETHTIT
jgi:hypothetical protein